jgi:hypothetical protein
MSARTTAATPASEAVALRCRGRLPGPDARRTLRTAATNEPALKRLARAGQLC